jgi:transcriptional regulator with XRE-family HTH domain
MSLGSNINEIRKNRGLSYDELANKAKINPRTLEKWISGKFIPRVDEAYAIAYVLGVTVEYLVAGEKGTNYVMEWAKKYRPHELDPDRLKSIIDDLQKLDDTMLEIARRTIRALPQNCPEVSPGEEPLRATP